MSYKHVVFKKLLKAIILKADTGATGNYIIGQDTIILNNLEPTNTGPRFRLPDNSIIKPRLYLHLPLPMLPSTATESHAYMNLKSDSLFSIGQLCYSIFSALITKKDFAIFNSDKNPVLNGTRNTSDGLWDVTIETSQPEPPPTATTNQHENSVLLLYKTKSELDSYLHAAVGCPTKSTFI